MNSDRHTYEYDVDPESNTAPAAVVRFVGEGKKVLEIGCGPGSITRILSVRNDCEVTGADLDPDAIKKVRQYCKSVHQVNLNDADWPNQIGSFQGFDVVVAADVLEHLYHPKDALSKMKSFVSKDGYMVISLPHVGHAAISACLLSGDFKYRDWGLLDKTHIRFFCLKNIEDLFWESGLKIVDFHYVLKPPEETEFASEWASLPSAARTVLRSFPHCNIYQVVVKAVPADRLVDGCKLSTEAIAHGPRNFELAGLKRRILARMSCRLKNGIKRIIRVLQN